MNAGRFMSLAADPAALESALLAAVQALRAGGIVALPTDTVYGVAATLTHARRLYDIKRRPADKPVAICVASVQQVYRWCQVTVAESLLHRLLPGAVTLVFRRTAALPAHVNPSTALVGVRIPRCELVRELVRRLGEPLALTSANVAGTASSLAVEDFADLWPELELVIDGGRVDATGDERTRRRGSTVVDLSLPARYHVVREGCALPHTEATLRAHGLRPAGGETGAVPGADYGGQLRDAAADR